MAGASNDIRLLRRNTWSAYNPDVDRENPDADGTMDERRRRRLELARRAFLEFHAVCFWSYRPDAEITEAKIPLVVQGLREHGGLAGYRVAAELCH